MWLLILSLSYGQSSLGPQVYATEAACIAAGEGRTSGGYQVRFICQRVER